MSYAVTMDATSCRRPIASPLEDFVRRSLCAPRHFHGAGIRKPSQQRLTHRGNQPTFRSVETVCASHSTAFPGSVLSTPEVEFESLCRQLCR